MRFNLIGQPAFAAEIVKAAKDAGLGKTADDTQIMHEVKIRKPDMADPVRVQLDENGKEFIVPGKLKKGGDVLEVPE